MPALVGVRAPPSLVTGDHGRSGVPSRVTRTVPPAVRQTVRPVSAAVSAASDTQAPPVPAPEPALPVAPGALLRPPSAGPPDCVPQPVSRSAVAARTAAVV